MTVYEFLKKLQSNRRVRIVRGEIEYGICSDSVDLLDETVQDSEILTWDLIDRMTIKIELEEIIPSA